MKRRGIIADIEDLLGRRTGLRTQVAGYAVSGVLQGIAIVTLIPSLRHLTAREYTDTFVWTLVGFLAFIASAIALALTSKRGYRVGVFEVSEGLTDRLVDHVAKLPLGWFTAKRRGQMPQLVSEIQGIGNFPAMVLEQTTLALTTPATVVVFVALVDWRLSLAFLAMVPLGIICYRRIQRAQAPTRIEEAKATAEVAGRVLEFASAQAVLRASGNMVKGLARLDDALESDRHATVRTHDRSAAPMLAYAAVVRAGVSIVTVVAVAMVLAGWIDAPATIAVLLLVLRFTEPLALVGLPTGPGCSWRPRVWTMSGRSSTPPP